VSRLETAVLLLGITAVSGSAQPGIRQNGVFNSASRIPVSFAGGAIAPGALITIIGTRLGQATQTHVDIVQNGTTNPLKIAKMSEGEIQAILPRSQTHGQASIVLTSDGKASKPFPITIAPTNLGIFSRNRQGWGPGRIDNLDASMHRSPNSTENPARPGQRVRFIVTGFGAAKTAQLVIGTRVVNVGSPAKTAVEGEEEITAQLPANVVPGCYVPVYALSTLNQASNVVTISIRGSEKSCDPGPVPLLAGKKIAMVTLFRTRMNLERKNAISVRDVTKVLFGEINHEIIEPPLLLLPPPGSCTAYINGFPSDLGLVNSIALSLIVDQGSSLDAGGGLKLNRAGLTREIPRLAPGIGVYRVDLGRGEAASKRGVPVPFLDPGDLELKAPGGPDIGAFSLWFKAPVPFEWTDLEQSGVIDRSHGATVHWRGVPSDHLVLIVASNIDQITTVSGSCICVARAGAGQMTIPSALLAHIPPTQDIPGTPFDQLYVASAPANAAVPMRTGGLDTAVVFSVYARGRIVKYQ
jgi:uncharacterized protein (TIGR03437 family)